MSTEKTCENWLVILCLENEAQPRRDVVQSKLNPIVSGISPKE